MNKEIHELLKIKNDETTIFTNKELKMIDDYINELEAYKYNMDRDYLRIEKENQELKTHQKEFIVWLENEININPYDISDYDYENIINTILSTYKEIIDK